MEKEDKITTNKYETLQSQVARLSEEVVGMKSRRNGSAASTMAASPGSGGSTSNFAAQVMPNSFVATHVEGTSVERGSRWMRLRAWPVKLRL